MDTKNKVKEEKDELIKEIEGKKNWETKVKIIMKLI